MAPHPGPHADVNRYRSVPSESYPNSCIILVDSKNVCLADLYRAEIRKNFGLREKRSEHINHRTHNNRQ